MRSLISIFVLWSVVGCGKVVDPGDVCTPECGDNASCTASVCKCDPGFVGDGATCREPFTLQATEAFDVDPSGFGSQFVPHGDAVFIAIETNTPTSRAFRSFNTATRTLSGPLMLPPTTADDFCACGATQTMVSDGRQIFMFGNFGQRYDPPTNQWTEITGYSSPTDFRRAESASVFNPMSVSVQIFGGRGPVVDTVNFAVATSTFAFGANLPLPISDAVAHLPANGGTIFLAGGEQGSTEDRILSRPTSIESWTIHPAAPGSLRSPIGMGSFGNRIWVATRDGTIHFYNPAMAVWDRTLSLPADTQAVTTTSAGTFAFVRTDAGQLEVYKLDAIE